ncbi:MAG: hypothetical protein KF744_06570 [Taibaiella sp.]|nr:hypothetical protein [Taibaiella sp.]
MTEGKIEQILIGFEDDICKEVERIFSVNCIKHKPGSYGEALLDFLTINRKYIKQQAREILLSKEINQNRLQNLDRWNQLQNIVKKAGSGENLNPFQSRKLYEPNSHDALLYNWHIHHLHLSPNTHNRDQRFNERTEYLVFAVIHPTTIYFLDFDSHHTDYVFAEENWLRIIVNNWPSLLTPYDGDPVFSNGQAITNELRNKLWKNYSLGFAKVDGKAYVHPGIGVTLSGHSLMVVNQRNLIIRWIYEHSKFLAENKTQFEDAFLKLFNISSDEIVYKLRLVPTIQIYEQTTQDILFEYPNYVTKRANFRK